MTQAQPPADPDPVGRPRRTGGSRRVFGEQRDPRLLVAAGAGVLDLLVAGGVYTATRGGGSDAAPTTRGPASTTAVAPTDGPSADAGVADTPSTSMFGVSIPLGMDGTAPRIVQSIKNQFGSIPVARVFSATPPPEHWTDDPTLAALGGSSKVVYTFKGDATAAARGDYDQQVTSFLSSRPKGLKVWFGFYHEPEDQVEAGTFTAAQYVAATAHLAPVIDAAGGVSTTILMGYTLMPGSGRDWHDYYSPAVDVIAWDVYNTGVKRADPIYKPVSAVMDPILEVQKETGKPFGIAEFGSQCIVSDPDCTGRAAWVAALGQAFKQDGAQFATYFDQKGVRGGPDYRLEDPPSSQAYRALIED